MTYIKTDWKDRVVETPLTFTLQNNPDGTVTLIPAEGQIIEAGTSINAVNMNNLEKQYEEAVAWVKGFGIGGTSIGLSTDCNSDLANGMYYALNSALNKPPGIDEGFLTVEAIAGLIKQTFMHYSGRYFIRRKFNGAWNAWEEVRTDKPVVWYDVPLFNGAVSAPGRNVKYTKEGKRVTIEGELQAGIGSGTYIGMLPDGYKPAQLKLFKLSHNSGAPNAGITAFVDPNGNICMYSVSNPENAISLCGISFYID